MEEGQYFHVLAKTLVIRKITNQITRNNLEPNFQTARRAQNAEASVERSLMGIIQFEPS